MAQPSVAHISENATQLSQRLVQNIALVVRGKEEVIKLSVVSLLARGHLLLEDVPGVGKTTLARGIISALTGEKEAPSPTFALVEIYETPAFPLYHFDLYRLKEPEDVFELGVEEAFDEGVSLIEWPEMIEKIIPKNVLVIRLEAAGRGRRASIAPRGRWRAQPKTLDQLRRIVEASDSADKR